MKKSYSSALYLKRKQKGQKVTKGAKRSWGIHHHHFLPFLPIFALFASSSNEG
ncbi:MAG: hypothetical protein J2P31_17395 [Blastocatellia bacterium]|nr:hypothetical protein [Blastocatellia bacterium]